LPDNNNTQSVRNESIQVTTFQLFHKYGQLLAERDADLNGLMKVDLGPVFCPKLNYTLVDIEDSTIPLPDNSVGVINASHVLQKVSDKTKIISEIYRVLSDGGWAFIEIPSTDGRGAFQDPTHVSFWNQNSFLYYTRKEKADYIQNTTIKFQEFRLETNWW
jgi:SAM-dependent methyltransferase